MTAHKHAENMRLYAEDAAEIDRPWERWECRSSQEAEWDDAFTCHPNWSRSLQYRRKQPATKIVTFECWMINGTLYWKAESKEKGRTGTRIPSLDKTAEVPA